MRLRTLTTTAADRLSGGGTLTCATLDDRPAAPMPPVIAEAITYVEEPGLLGRPLTDAERVGFAKGIPIVVDQDGFAMISVANPPDPQLLALGGCVEVGDVTSWWSRWRQVARDTAIGAAAIVVGTAIAWALVGLCDLIAWAVYA